MQTNKIKLTHNTLLKWKSNSDLPLKHDLKIRNSPPPYLSISNESISVSHKDDVTVMINSVERSHLCCNSSVKHNDHEIISESHSHFLCLVSNISVTQNLRLLIDREFFFIPIIFSFVHFMFLRIVNLESSEEVGKKVKLIFVYCPKNSTKGERIKGDSSE